MTSFKEIFSENICIWPQLSWIADIPSWDRERVVSASWSGPCLRGSLPSRWTSRSPQSLCCSQRQVSDKRRADGPRGSKLECGTSVEGRSCLHGRIAKNSDGQSGQEWAEAAGKNFISYLFLEKNCKKEINKIVATFGIYMTYSLLLF